MNNKGRMKLIDFENQRWKLKVTMDKYENHIVIIIPNNWAYFDQL